MVELFIAGRLTRTPELVAPAALVTKSRLPTRARLSEPKARTPCEGFICATSCCINTPTFRPSRPVKPPAIRRTAWRGISPSPVFRTAPDQWDRTHGLLLPERRLAPDTVRWDCARDEGITRVSLPRTGRATLMASSSTGEQWCEQKLAAGWSAPHPLGRLAPALPGPLHPTSTTPSHVFLCWL
jgi:hypothetical protein